MGTQMKIAFFSEIGNNQKYTRDFPNQRTEISWCLALDAPMCALDVLPDGHFDLGIVIVPKTNPNVNLDFIRKCCDKVAVMQEGPHWYFQDYEIVKQFHYYNTLRNADWVYCHNESDAKYYLGLGCKDVRVMRSLMIPHNLLPRSEWRDATMIGRNFVSWYGGIDSYLVASEVDEQKYGVSMGRKQEQEQEIDDIKYLPYMDWREWINHIGQYRVGVHLMRTHAAGTFSMNLAYHGTPVIGYKGLDTQELLHPQTTVKVGDLVGAKEIMTKLTEDEDFYQECSEQTRSRFKKYITLDSLF